jgi:hypothetical protein
MSTSRCVRVESQSLEYYVRGLVPLISVIRFRFQEWSLLNPTGVSEHLRARIAGE